MATPRYTVRDMDVINTGPVLSARPMLLTADHVRGQRRPRGKLKLPVDDGNARHNCRAQLLGAWVWLLLAQSGPFCRPLQQSKLKSDHGANTAKVPGGIVADRWRPRPGDGVKISAAFKRIERRMSSRLPATLPGPYYVNSTKGMQRMAFVTDSDANHGRELPGALLGSWRRPLERPPRPVPVMTLLRRRWGWSRWR